MNKRNHYPAAWVPSLYFAESLPYMLINIVAVPMYLDLGLSEKWIPLYVGFLGYAWTFKPLWSPVVELYGSRRSWTLNMQLILTLGFFLVGMVIGTGQYFLVSFSILALLSFVSATHDIAIDGLYLEALSEKEQSMFIGIRNFFYRVGLLFARGPLLILVGMLMAGKLWADESTTNGEAYSWGWYLCGAFFGLLWVYHYIFLPKASLSQKKEVEAESLIEELGKEEGREAEQEEDIPQVLELKKSFFELWVSFFDKKNIGIMVAFLLLYRLGESQIQAIGQTFLKMDKAQGGLGLTTEEFGTIYGTFGTLGLIIGGILGGVLISRDGLKKWLWPMVIGINLPNALYVYLSYFKPENPVLITTCITIEQLGYGFGFTAFLMYMIYMAKGKYQTAHYAIATGFMALGNILPLQISGFIKEWLGSYPLFFTWTLVATLPAFIVTAFIPLEKDFGKKDE